MKDFAFFKSRAHRFDLEVKSIADDITMVYGEKYRFDNWLIEDKGDHFNLWHLSKNHRSKKAIVTRKDSRRQQLNACSYHFQKSFSKRNRRKILRYIKDHNEYVAFYKKRNKINLVDRVLGNI